MPLVPVEKLWQRLTQGDIAPCYLFFGTETYLIQEYTTACLERLLGTAPRDFNCDVFHLETSALSEALGMAHTLPVLSARRVVVLQALQVLDKTAWQHLEAYLEQPSESTVLLCSCNESEQRKFPARFWQHTVAIACAPLDMDKLHAWVARTVAQRGYRITDDAIQGILQEQERDLQMILREIEKLCSYVGDAGQITLEAVQHVGYASRLLSIFALADALGSRKLVPALTMVSGLLDQGEPPLVIFSLVVRHFRLLWQVRHLTQQQQDLPRIVKALGLPTAVCRQLLVQSKLFSLEHLRRLYAAALEADMAFKTSNKPPRAILERLILDVCVNAA